MRRAQIVSLLGLGVGIVLLIVGFTNRLFDSNTSSILVYVGAALLVVAFFLSMADTIPEPAPIPAQQTREQERDLALL